MDTEHVRNPLSSLDTKDVAGLYHVNQRKLYKLQDFQVGGKPKSRIFVGRAKNCDVRIDDKTVSDLHCMITKRRDGSYLLEDHKSSNGIRVSSADVQSLVLVRGLRMRLGNAELVVVGADLRVALNGSTHESFLYRAALNYGSDRKASEAVGKSEATVRRARRGRQSPDTKKGKKKSKKRSTPLSWLTGKEKD